MINILINEIFKDQKFAKLTGETRQRGLNCFESGTKTYLLNFFTNLLTKILFSYYLGNYLLFYQFVFNEF